jgi:hypothetical protein
MFFGGLVSAAAAAPNCGLTGKWKMTGNLDFANVAAVMDCTINITSTGKYTGLCSSWTTGNPALPDEAVSGTIKANAQCKLSGVLTAPNVVATTIRGGMVSNDGQLAVLVGSRGTDPNNPPQVRFLILMKQ